MSKKDRIIHEITEKTGEATGILGLVASTLIAGPIGPLLLCNEHDQFTTRIRDEDNNEYIGKGSTEAASKGDAYSKMK